MTKRGKKKTRRQQQVKLKCQKNEKPKKMIFEVNKISRRQMKSLKAKEKKKKSKTNNQKNLPQVLSQVTMHKILFVFSCCHKVEQLYIYIYM